MNFKKVIIFVVFLNSLFSEICKRIEQIILMIVCYVVKCLMWKSSNAS